MDRRRDLRSVVTGARLLVAIGSGRADQVARMLADGADPETAGLRGRTALVKAAAIAAPEIVSCLLAHGADVNRGATTREPGVGEVSGVTALMAAADRTDPRPDILRLLLAHGADPDAVDSLGRSALMRAVGRGHRASIRALTDAGAEVDTVNLQGRSALDAARDSGSPDALKLLLAASATRDPNAR